MGIDPKKLEVIELGTSYALPVYTIESGKGLVETNQRCVIDFVRGSKLAEEEIQPNDGILHEGLLAMQIADLKYKQTLVYSTETKMVIESLETALFWMEQRANRRKEEGTQGTYKQ